MSLTGIPVLVVTACVTGVVAAATVLRWRRPGRATPVLRVLGLLLTEMLTLVSVGLVVNRTQQFYPTWQALFHRGSPADPPVRYTAGTLDGWLGDRFAGRENLPSTFVWRPQGWTHWSLDGAPTVTVPAGYLRHPEWRYPVVLVICRAQDGWSARVRPPAAPAVLIWARTAASTPSTTLTTTLPSALAVQLRVTGHSWALVTSTGDASLGEDVARRQPGRYAALAVVTVGRHVPTARLPAGVAQTTVGGTSPAAAVGPRAAEVAKAVAWAGRHLPAPLAAPAPLLPPAPGRHHRRHGHPSPPLTRHDASTGGDHGSGQPRR
ncbi:hypothetical protein AB0368_33715 [Actinoplanes sp. NPDC051475]|uniref:hypothetical protein n=1 Tax=Actinoplanes sp. NPDC051475 TaxID=3157225 RepID=UPI00344BB422